MSKKGLGKVLFGSALGVGLGFLFAPKKGEETRKLILQWSNNNSNLKGLCKIKEDNVANNGMTIFGLTYSPVKIGDNPIYINDNLSTVWRSGNLDSFNICEDAKINDEYINTFSQKIIESYEQLIHKDFVYSTSNKKGKSLSETYTRLYKKVNNSTGETENLIINKKFNGYSFVIIA